MAAGDPYVHLPVGEATVTLQYVALLLGLWIDGRAVTFPPYHDWRDSCTELLGIITDDPALVVPDCDYGDSSSTLVVGHHPMAQISYSASMHVHIC